MPISPADAEKSRRDPMKSYKSYAPNKVRSALVLTGLVVWLVLPSGLHRVTLASRPVKFQDAARAISSANLDPVRETALQDLFAQFKAGKEFSAEEAYLLTRFEYAVRRAEGKSSLAKLEPVSQFEADVVISRALYAYYVSKQELTSKQKRLLTEYQSHVAQNGRIIADLKSGPRKGSPRRVSTTSEENCGNAIVLTFEGLSDLEPVRQFYNGGNGGFGSGPGPEAGVSFSSNSLAIIDQDDGGSGNFGGEPSPSTVLFFLEGEAATMNVPEGFTSGFSFYYSSPQFTTTITVYSGLDATGTVLAVLPLPLTPLNGAPDPTGDFSPLVPIGVSFSGIAKSVDFGGMANRVGFDNVTIGCPTPLACVGNDTEPPSIACPTNVSIQCPSASGPKYPLPSFTDNCPEATIVCFPPPDSNFGPGTTGINCEATDQAGNSSRCTFTVTVEDITPPIIIDCPGTVLIPNPQQACSVPVNVTGLVNATDNCTAGGSLTKMQIPAAGTPLAAGTTQTVTVVVRDAAGNQRSCPVVVTVGAGPAVSVKVTPEPVDLGSIKLFGAKKKNKVKPTSTEATFTVENIGCASLTVSPRAINRVTDGGRMNADDSTFFKVTLANGQPFTSASLVKGAPLQLKVTFNPSVPSLSTCGTSGPSSACLRASNVLPSSFQSVLSFNGTDKTVTFTAGAAQGVKLIDSTNPSATNGVAQLCRSGDQFVVTYFLYDSNTSDGKTVKYEFLDSSGDTVKVLDNVDLAGPISRAGFVNGMSFKVSQAFSGANDNDNVTKVRVTVTGVGGSSSTAESTGNSGCGVSAQAVLEGDFTTLFLPTRRPRAVKP